MRQTEISNRELDPRKRVILFWIRHEIDLDSSTPVIAKLAENSSLKIQCVVVNLRETFDDDWRIIYLKSLSVDVIHVYELLKINRIVTNTVFVSNSKRAKNFPHRILKIIYKRIIFSPVLSYLRYRVDHLNLRKLPRVINDKFSSQCRSFRYE